MIKKERKLLVLGMSNAFVAVLKILETKKNFIQVIF